MKNKLLSLALLCTLVTPNIALADHDEGRGHSFTMAVYGDWPYSANLLSQAPLLVDSINSDKQVRMVMHVGDIHSGSMPCTGAGLSPIPAGSVPGWNKGIFDIFQQFNAPVVYTPGDNEWTDCHKKKQSSSGYPLNELAAVRSLFFAHPGMTLGKHPMEVDSQAKEHEVKTDAQFVENVRFQKANVMFVTLNVPGSNDDTLPWTGVFSNTAAQAKEVSERQAANLRWLQGAFEEAEESHAKGMVIGLQANMWDPAALVAGGDGLNAYTTFVNKLADLSVKFGRPVLLINGDTHVFEVDHPLADPTSASGMIHHTRAVPNLTRVTVEGSTAANEWVKLTVDPGTTQVFSWERVQYLP